MKTHTKTLLAALTASAMIAASAHAAPIVVTNPSFETGDPSISSETGWTRGINGGFENSGNFITDGDTDADRFEVLIGRFGNATKEPFWYQDTGHTPTAGLTYTLTVDVATSSALGSIARIELVGNDTDTVYATSDFTPLATNTWYEDSASYVSTGTEGETLGIRLSFGSSGASDRVEFNNVRLDAVPEPGSLALLGLGGLLMLKRRRRQA